jgi:uncharacterized coiled-coil protein SlyX
LVTVEEASALGVPPDLQEQLLKQVNEALSQTHANLDRKFEAQHKELYQRVQSLQNHLSSPQKKVNAS